MSAAEASRWPSSVPTPPEAIEEPSVWLHLGDGAWTRHYVAWRREPVEEVVVSVLGHQDHTGHIDREITVETGPDGGLDAGQARAVAAALIEAATEVERLAIQQEAP
ncbi:hypothetical protein BVU76_22435 [Mycolicibacterium porcinum]|nr:hypothetical protein BVU76_22435 [Mycolicibacterium porcinum]